MTKYFVLCSHKGAYEIDGKKGYSHYLIAVKDNSCKPAIIKCSETVYKDLNGACDILLHLYFDEKGKCVSYDYAEED